MPHSAPPSSAAAGPATGTCTAFLGFHCIASGQRPDVAARLATLAPPDPGQVLVFDDDSGQLIDLQVPGLPAPAAAGRAWAWWRAK